MASNEYDKCIFDHSLSGAEHVGKVVMLYVFQNYGITKSKQNPDKAV